jgi:hypothetical protein
MKRCGRIAEPAGSRRQSAVPRAELSFDPLSYRSRAEALLEVSGEIRSAISNLRRWPVHGEADRPLMRTRRIAADRHLEAAMQNLLRIEDLARELIRKL